MKKTITLLAGSFLWLGLAAQTGTNPTFKTEGTNTRLIASNYNEWKNAAWKDYDSVAYSYSGTRGGNVNGTPIKSDMTTKMLWDSATATLKNVDRTTSTYNAANELTSQTTLQWDGTAWQNISKVNYITSGLDAITLTQYWRSGAWMDSIRATITKDANGKTTLNMNEIMVAGAWAAHTSKATYTYNARGLQEVFINFANVGGVYEEVQKIDYVYDAADNATMNTISRWVSGAWVLANQYAYTYNANRAWTTQVSFSYVSGAFVPTDSTTRLYNAANKQTDQYRHVYTSGAYVNSYHLVYQYDLQGNNIYFQNDNWGAGVWVPLAKQESQFNANNKRTEQITYGWVAGAWVNSSKITNVYDANNKILDDTRYDWVAGAWEGSSKTSYLYDANSNIINETRYSWVSGAWQGTSKVTYLFNANSLKTEQINYTASAGVFTENRKINWNYNSANLYTTVIVQDWLTGAWQNTARSSYFYETYQDGVGISESSIKASAVYPNPFTKNTLIDFTSKTDGDLTFTVSDINGRVLHTENNYYPTGANSILFEGESLSVGIYVYTLSGKSGKATGRIVKQ